MRPTDVNRINSHAAKGMTTPDVGQLELPPIHDSLIPNFKLAGRAVTIVFGTIGFLLAAILVASFIVEMNLTVDADGAMEPIMVWPIRPLSGGIVAAVTVATRDTVHRGQTLVQLDTLSAYADLEKLTAQLAEEEASYAHASALAPLTENDQREAILQAELKLQQVRIALREQVVDYSASANVDSVLARYKTGNNLNVDRALADERAAESELHVAESALRRARLAQADLVKQHMEVTRLRREIAVSQAQRQRLSVVAPSDGVVLTDQLERLVGSYVQAGAQLLEVADAHRWRVVLRVPERDVHDLAVGQRASIEIPALKALDGRKDRKSVV